MELTQSDILQVLVVPLIGYGIYLLKDISKQLSKINTSLSSLTQWTIDHEALDTERNINLREEITQCKQHWVNHDHADRDKRNRRAGDNCPLDEGGV